MSFQLTLSIASGNNRVSYVHIHRYVLNFPTMDDTISSRRSSDESGTKEIFKVRKGMMAYVKIEERALLSIARLWTLLSSNLLFITMVRFLSETLLLFPSSILRFANDCLSCL